MINGTITATMEALAKLFDWRKSKSDNQPINEVIDDKKDLEKACNCAEKAFKVVEEHAIFWHKSKEKQFKDFVSDFRRYK